MENEKHIWKEIEKKFPTGVNAFEHIEFMKNHHNLKSTDLRIGNWVFEEVLGNIKVYEICNEYASLLAKHSDEGNDVVNKAYHINYPNIKGIPLDDELILKCGFVDVNSYKDYVLYVDDYNEFRIEISIRKEKAFFTCLSDFPLKYNIKYLHELQNLYFSLTKKELEVEL